MTKCRTPSMHSTFSCSFTIPGWSSCLRISISFFRAFRVCSSFGICTAFTATSPPTFESLALKTTEKAPRPTVPMCLKRPFSYLSGKTSLASALQSVVEGPNMVLCSDSAESPGAASPQTWETLPFHRTRTWSYPVQKHGGEPDTRDRHSNHTNRTPVTPGEPGATRSVKVL